MEIPMTITPQATAFPMPDYSVRFPQKAMPPHTLSSQEAIELFGESEAVCMNFIPQMLVGLALRQAEEFILYCSENRLKEYAKYSRQMRKVVDEYRLELRKHFGTAWRAYCSYLERLTAYTDVDMFKCWCTFTNEAARQYVDNPHKDIPARIALIRMILLFVEDFDKNMDKVIADRLNAPCHRKQDPYCFLLSVLCMDIANTFGFEMAVTQPMALCVKVLANRCREVATAIMADENAAS